MRKNFLLFFITIGFIAITVLFLKNNSLPTITYFPNDTENKFVHADSKLSFFNKDTKGDSYIISWESGSESNESFYLRQDVSLLFENGRLRGVRSKWSENTDSIQFKEKLYGNTESIFEVISYHHGEIHYPDDRIKSIQQMTSDRLYVADLLSSKFSAFRSPTNDNQTTKKNTLEKLTKSQLLSHWKHLIRYFNLDEEAYVSIPLSHLYKYNNRKLPGMTQAETDKIIGQLWEGLYKNYIISASNTEKDSTTPNYLPLILFSKDKSHLIVIYELNGEKEKLVQQL